MGLIMKKVGVNVTMHPLYHLLRQLTTFGQGCTQGFVKKGSSLES